YGSTPASPSGLPYAMHRSAVFSGDRDTIPHRLDQRFEVLQRRRGQHAVAEVEDMAGPPGRPAQHVPRRLDHYLAGREHRGRVEVALHAAVVSDAPPSLVQVDAPVE